MLHIMVLLDAAVLLALALSLVFPDSPAISPHPILDGDESSSLPLMPLVLYAVGVVYLAFLFWATRPNPNAEIKIIAFFLGFVPLALGIACFVAGTISPTTCSTSDEAGWAVFRWSSTNPRRGIATPVVFLLIYHVCVCVCVCV